MNDLPRQKLREIIQHYGRDIVEDPQRCRALLLDLCGEHRREVNVLSSALSERVAADLLASMDHTPLPLLLSRLTQRLQDNLALDKDAARWAVETWAVALGVASESELVAHTVSLPKAPVAPASRTGMDLASLRQKEKQPQERKRLEDKGRPPVPRAETSPLEAAKTGKSEVPPAPDEDQIASAATSGESLRASEGLVKLVTELYSLLGHKIEAAVKRPDHDVDLVIRSSNGRKWIARCRSWDVAVSENEVRDFYGVMQQEHAAQGAIITLGSFTLQARQWAKSNLLYLLDKNEFLDYLKRARARAGAAGAHPTAAQRGRLVVHHLPVGLLVPPAVELNKSPFTVGRISCDLTMPDSRLSRRHAVITQEHGQFYIQDAASANGTLLNGVRLDSAEKALLTPGAIIGLGGDILLRFELY